MKQQIMECVHSFPGIHLRGIVKHLDTSTALAHYHLDHLVQEKRVREVRVGGFTRYFPQKEYRDLSAKDRQVVQFLRQERPLQIVLSILEYGSMQHRDLLEIVGGSKGTLTYHLDNLVEAGIVRKVPKGPDKGFHVVDPAGVRRLLARYEPLPDVYDQVHELWDDLFRGHKRVKKR